MAWLCSRVVFTTCRRSLSLSAARCADTEFASQLDHATGLEKRELLASAAGNDDPYNMKIIKRGVGTKDQPNLVPSAFSSRLIGCICEEEQTHVVWMWLHQGNPRRCECGHWFKLVEKAPI